ncbi:AraC family transcriptional regulator [Nocardioides campestrisoli]|uniref:AraC family transcriptional regulator n=1 Tax=Nocardioides campestrisoli TaxID=2736757 RepID=UPI001CD7CBB3|nr:AraC family transcriptional regulator [Nocardioides campestrisoli]
MIKQLNAVVQAVEGQLGDPATDELDVATLAHRLATTEYHLRRMFSALAGMPLSEYARRRRMTAAAHDLLTGDDDLLTVAVRHGYGSVEAFTRAFRGVHGATPSVVRRDGGPLRAQGPIRFHLTVEGSTVMEARLTALPAFRVVGRAARVPLVHLGENPHIRDLVASVPPEEHARLKAMSEGEPAGILAVSTDLDPDRREGTELTYLHGVVTSRDPGDFDVIEVPALTWAVFRSSGPYPRALQETWAATATEWFPANPWLLVQGPEIVAVLERAEDFSTATTEIWLPVEPDRS